MASVDKNQALITYLLECPQMKDNKLFFNAIDAKDNDKQIIASATSRTLSKQYLDGSIEKRITFTIVDYRSVSYRALVKRDDVSNENLAELYDIQSIIDWVATQNDARTFPNFGDDCIVESIQVATDTPNLNGIDTSVTPALAKYSFAIQVDYIDKTHSIWNA